MLDLALLDQTRNVRKGMQNDLNIFLFVKSWRPRLRQPQGQEGMASVVPMFILVSKGGWFDFIAEYNP
jgi:hypothetical protein